MRLRLFPRSLIGPGLRHRSRTASACSADPAYRIKGSPIRGPGASTNSVSHPDSRFGGHDVARSGSVPGATQRPGFLFRWLRGRTARQSPIRIKASGRPPMADVPGPWHVSRAPENLRCPVASNWLDHRSRGSRRRRVQPLVAHDMGAALETLRRLGPIAVATASNQIWWL